MTNKKAKDQPSQSLSQSKIDRLENGNIKITITIPWETIATHYHLALSNFKKKTTVKGFRPGKAPDKLVEEKIGKTKIYQVNNLK